MIFLTMNTYYTILVLKRAHFIFTKAENFDHCVDFCVIHSVKMQSALQLNQCFYICMFWYCKYQRSLKKTHNKLISSRNLNTRCLVVSILKSKSTSTSLPVNSFPYEQTGEPKPLGCLHAFNDCFIHYILQVFFLQILSC